MSPPKETAATCDDGWLTDSNCNSPFITQLKEINSIAPAAWSREGWRLLDEWQRSGNSRHLEAFNRHVSGIRARLSASLERAH